MAKGKTPLYLSYIDTINGLLNSIKFSAELPVHKKSIDRSGRNVEWLRKGIKRGKLTIPGVDIGNEFWKLAQLLEVEAPVYGTDVVPVMTAVDLGKKESGGLKPGEFATVSATTDPSKSEVALSSIEQREGRIPAHKRSISKSRHFAENYGTNADVTASTKTLDKYETR
ncbi:hypothetical protein Pori4_00213 [Pseudomonas phage vB_PpuM-Pori-4]